MGKNKDEAVAPEATAGKGRAVMFKVNGVETKRVDYIRDRFYNDGATRSEILKEVRELQGDETIAYQIIFAATKTKERPIPKPRGKKADEAATETTSG